MIKEAANCNAASQYNKLKTIKMKKQLLWMILSMLFIWACGGGNEKTSDDQSNEKTSTEEKVDAMDTDAAKNCQEFLDRYEKWIDEYLLFLEDYKENPFDPELGKKYAELMPEFASWSQQWTKLYECASKQKYQERFDKIAAKVDKKMEELGFDE